MPVVAGTRIQTFASEDVTVDATAGGVLLTQATYFPGTGGPAKAATINVEDAQIRWTKASGASLTASAGGSLAFPGQAIFLDALNDIVNFRAIRTSSTSATINAAYHR